MITFDNFFIGTTGIFKGCKTPKRKPDFVSMGKRGTVSSTYWYGEDSKGPYVIRNSDHWVLLKKIGSNKIYSQCDSIASCTWHIKTTQPLDGCISGKCYLKDFTKKL